MVDQVTGFNKKQIKLILECIESHMDVYEGLDYAWLFNAKKALQETLNEEDKNAEI